MRKLLLVVACLMVTGCMNSAPCEEKWAKYHTSEGVLYVKESSSCVSVKMKEIYQ